jgi:hypothetical protein
VAEAGTQATASKGCANDGRSQDLNVRHRPLGQFGQAVKQVGRLLISGFGRHAKICARA